jgi:hypothetical protein
VEDENKPPFNFKLYIKFPNFFDRRFITLFPKVNINASKKFDLSLQLGPIMAFIFGWKGPKFTEPKKDLKFFVFRFFLKILLSISIFWVKL